MKPVEFALLIPSCPRPGADAGRLPALLQRLDAVLSARDREVTRIAVLDTSSSGERHGDLERATREAAVPFECLERKEPVVGLEAAANLAEGDWLRGYGIEKVRWCLQQGRDFATLMRYGLSTHARYLVRLEDDSRVTVRFLDKLRKQAGRFPETPYLSLFSSRSRPDGCTTAHHGSAVGLLFHRRERVEPILRFLQRHEHRQPFDVVLGWYRDDAGKRGLTVYPSLVQHVGMVSTLKGARHDRNPDYTSPTYRDDDQALSALTGQLSQMGQWTIRGTRAFLARGKHALLGRLES